MTEETKGTLAVAGQVEQVVRPGSEANETINEMAERTCWRYNRSSDPSHSDTYTFNDATLAAFTAKVQEVEREQCAKHLRAMAAWHQRAADTAKDIDKGRVQIAMAASLLAAIKGPNVRANL
jgi:hypothetical protein